MPTKILSISYDYNLLLDEDPLNEGQYRQKKYCDLLDQQKAFIVLLIRNTGAKVFQQMHQGRIQATAIDPSYPLFQVLPAYYVGKKVGKLFKPDLIEYQDPLFSGLTAYYLSRHFEVPLVGGVFNDNINNLHWIGMNPFRMAYNKIAQHVVSNSDAVRCDSPETTKTLQNRGFSQVTYIPFYISHLEKFRVSDDTMAQRLQTWHHDPKILCVARLNNQKNIPLLLRAFAAIYHQHQRGTLQIVGDGPEASHLKNLVHTLKIDHCVEWLGNLGYQDLVSYYRKANIFALSSDQETSARVLTMAQVARLPTLTTKTSGTESQIMDDITGYITPIGDQQAFQIKLETLLNNETNYQTLLSAQDERLLANYGDAVITHKISDFYNSITK